LYPSSHKKKLFIRIVFFSFLFFFNFSFLFQYYIYWGVRFIFIFNLLFMRLSQSHDPDYELDELTRFTRVFSSFLIDFFIFQLHPSILDWLRIIFRFVFYEVILISWIGSQVRRVNPDWFESFFNWLFFQFHILTLSWLEIRLQSLF
jgi:hypothetical protein